MGHFAKVNNGVVEKVIVAEQDFIDSGAVGSASDWVQCSYNTKKGVHRLGGTPFRKNYPGVGYIYDEDRDAFRAKKPSAFPSFILNEETCIWEAPVKKPDDGKNYVWNEETQQWDLINE